MPGKFGRGAYGPNESPSRCADTSNTVQSPNYADYGAGALASQR